jgi:hypothetical protein
MMDGVCAGRRRAGIYLMVCHTSQPPPISASPASKKRPREANTVPAVQWMVPGSVGAGTSSGLGEALASPAMMRPSWWLPSLRLVASSPAPRALTLGTIASTCCTICEAGPGQLQHTVLWDSTLTVQKNLLSASTMLLARLVYVCTTGPL